MTTKQVKNILSTKFYIDKVVKKDNGNFYLIINFYYKETTSTEIAKKIKEYFPYFIILKNYDIIKPFYRGTKIEKQSHYYVEFKIAE